jgi:hypothetical protein
MSNLARVIADDDSLLPLRVRRFASISGTRR